MTKHVRLIISILATCLTLSLFLGFTPQVSAETDLTFIVNSFEDLDDNSPNSVCSAGSVSGGPCTLRAAIVEANANVVARNIFIEIPAGTYPLTIPPGVVDDVHSGDLEIAGGDTAYTITIKTTQNGPVIIQSMVNDRIFHIQPSGRVYIQDITLRDGNPVIIQNTNLGGGGILNEGSLNLAHVSLLSNQVTCAPGCDKAYVTGGAILNYGVVNMTDSIIAENTAERGSAIFNTGQGSEVKIYSSTIFDNLSYEGYTIVNYATMSLLNSTLTGNRTRDLLYTTGIANNNLLKVNSCTFANPGPNGSISNNVVGTFYTGKAYVYDSIFLADEGRHNCNIEVGSIWDGGHNIFSDDSCPHGFTGDLINTDPKLGPFGNHGGPTATLPLLKNSPAINHRPGVCLTVLGQITEDQRHYLRNDGNCDTGAFEGFVLVNYLPIIRR